MRVEIRDEYDMDDVITHNGVLVPHNGKDPFLAEPDAGVPWMSDGEGTASLSKHPPMPKGGKAPIGHENVGVHVDPSDGEEEKGSDNVSDNCEDGIMKDEADTIGEGQIPIDHGWAWMIVLGSFMVFQICFGHNIVLSVLLLDIIERFQTSLTIITIMLSLVGLAYSLSCQITINVLVPRTSVRKIFITSALVNALSSVFLAFVPNISLFIVFNFIKFFCHGALQMPSLALVGSYFRRRRALASSLSLLGVSCSVLTTPLFVSYLRDEFGFSGCFLLIAAYEMHGVVAGALHRPISSYSVQPARYQVIPNSVESNPSASTSDFPTGSPPPKSSEDAAGKSVIGRRVLLDHHWDYADPIEFIRSSGDEAAEKQLVTTPEVNERLRLREEIRRSKHRLLETAAISGSYHEVRVFQEREKGESPAGLSHPLEIAHSSDAINSRITKQRQTSKGTPLPHAPDKDSLRRRIAARSYRNCANQKAASSSTEFPPPFDFSPSLAISASNLASLEHLSHLEPRAKEAGGRGTSNSGLNLIKKVVRELFNFSALQSRTGLFYMVTYILGRSVGFVMMYLPTYAILLGVEKTKAALLMTVFGGVDMASRVVFGYIGDLHLTRPKNIMALTALCTGGIACFLPWYSAFPLLVFYAASMGFFGSVSLSLNTNNIIDLLGSDKLATCLSQSSLFLSLSYMIQNPVMGVVIDATGLLTVFYYTAACYLLCAALFTLHGIFTRDSSSHQA